MHYNLTDIPEDEEPTAQAKTDNTPPIMINPVDVDGDTSMRSIRSEAGRNVAEQMFKAYFAEIKSYPALQEGLLGRSPVETLASLRNLFNRMKMLDDKDTVSVLFRLMLTHLSLALGEPAGEVSPLIVKNTGTSDIDAAWEKTLQKLAQKFAFSPSRGTNNPGLTFLDKRFKQASEGWSSYINLVEIAHMVMAGGMPVPEGMICAFLYSRCGEPSSETRKQCSLGDLKALRKYLDEEEIRAAASPRRVQTVQVESAVQILAPLMEIVSQLPASSTIKEVVAKVETVFGKFKQPEKTETRTCYVCRVPGHIARDCPNPQPPAPKAPKA